MKLRSARILFALLSTAALAGCDAMMYKPFAPGNAFNRDGNFLRGDQQVNLPTYRPIVDGSRSDGKYEQDVNDCQRYGGQVSPTAAAAENAVAGAFVGAMIGAAIGDRKSFARYGATVGAVNGGVSGAVYAEEMQRQIIRNCMAGRGYVVLDGPTSVPIGVSNASVSQVGQSDQSASSFRSVPCDIVKDELKAQCARDHGN